MFNRPRLIDSSIDPIRGAETLSYRVSAECNPGATPSGYSPGPFRGVGQLTPHHASFLIRPRAPFSKGEMTALAYQPDNIGMDAMNGTQRIRVSLAPTQRTLLLTLYARVVDAQRPAPIVNDTRAAQVLNQVEHDPADLRSRESQQAVLLLRARQLDEWTAEFLESHPEATILHLACGLDSRCLRLKWGPKVRWIDVDFPDVVDLRTKVYENPEGDYELVPADVTDDEWLKQIPTDRPTAVVFEGLTPYLEEATGKALIRRLAEHFKTGQLIFDTVGPATVSLQLLVEPVKKAGAKFTWGVNDAEALTRLHPRLKLRDCLRPPEMKGFNHVIQPTRAFLSIYRRLPWFRNLSLCLRYDF
ncbi:hypothetical protein DL769_005928 [Monosporascus sp. CRB-8-3]|nr:hypothetical protein DL769_005928 [Monosporascus sp. CRB-8-3]